MPEFEVPKSTTVMGSDGEWREILGGVSVTAEKEAKKEDEKISNPILAFLVIILALLIRFWYIVLIPIIFYIFMKYRNRNVVKKITKKR